MYTLIILSTLSTLFFTTLSMHDQACFTTFTRLPQEIQCYIFTLALDPHTIRESLRTLQRVNKNCKHYFSKNNLMQDRIIRELALNNTIPPRMIALNIITLYKLNAQETQRLLDKYPANKGLDKLLIAAVQNGDKAQVQNLLFSNADVFAQDTYKVPALIWAARCYNDIVKMLLNAGADVNTCNSFNYYTTALIEAIIYRNEEIAATLINAGADVNIYNHHKVTAILQASHMGLEETVRLLLKAGADVNAQSSSGNTALMLAAQYSSKEIVELLLNANAKIDTQNTSGMTALALAQKKGRREIVQLLQSRVSSYSHQ